MPRFVLLNHDYPFLHWDFLLEDGEMLRAWRLVSQPVSPGTVDAEELPDHRPAYLDYEGPVSGNRGNVRRWDAGTFICLEQNEDALTVQLQGRYVQGLVRLRRVRELVWLFEWTRTD